MRKLFMTLLAGFLAQAPLGACPWCRPRVQAGIHTPAYAHNLLLVLLPVAVLLTLGAGVFYWEKLRPFLPRVYAAHS